MQLPSYTELSNFSTRAGGRKSSADITIALIINGNSDPVETINSIFKFASNKSIKCEFLMINTDKQGYKYDKLLASFPIMRVILPKDKIGENEAVKIAISESLSKNILFINEYFTLKTLDFNVLRMYLSETLFGILIPLVVDERDTVIPSIIKGGIRNSFLETISVDIVGTAISSLYSKYFCFLINRDAFMSRNIELNDYSDIKYTLLELGYKLWKEGYIITQVRNFKVEYSGPKQSEISMDFSSNDYLSFNLLNISEKSLLKFRTTKIILLAMSFLMTLRWQRLSWLFRELSRAGKIISEISSKPVEDSAIFSIINKDIK
jgi:hypothetical protein